MPAAAAGKVSATPAALALLAEIVAEHGPVIFHQSGGCCDGSSPMCYPVGEFAVGAHDVLLGEIGGAPVYIGGPQYQAWKHTDLIIDVVPGRGGMFSLDNGRPPSRTGGSPPAATSSRATPAAVSTARRPAPGRGRRASSTASAAPPIRSGNWASTSPPS